MEVLRTKSWTTEPREKGDPDLFVLALDKKPNRRSLSLSNRAEDTR